MHDYFTPDQRAEMNRDLERKRNMPNPPSFYKEDKARIAAQIQEYINARSGSDSTKPTPSQ